MKPNFLQICKGNEKIGLGHVIRSLSIYNELKKHSFNVIFYYYGSSISAISLIKDKIKTNNLIIKIDNNNLTNLIKKNTIIIFDAPENQFINFSINVKRNNLIVVFDFIKNIDFERKLYFTPIPKQKKDTLIDNSSYFDGPKYALLRNVFKKYHHKPRIINYKIKKILISFGGSDPKKYTEKLTKIIPQLINSGFKIHLIMPSQRKIENANNELKQNDNLVIHKKFTNIFKIGISVDLIICSGGGTLWEMCCIGTPILAIPQSKQERQAITYLSKKKACIPLNKTHLIKKELLKILTKLNLNHQMRISLSENGKKEVDGLGVSRVINEIKEVYKKIS